VRNLEDGVDLMGEMKGIRRFYFAMEIRGSGRPLLGNDDYSASREAREPMLTSHNDSSLVVDRLCNQARGQNTLVTCFYFDFAARKEQSATNMLGSLLKQMVNGMERIPDDISRAFQEQKQAIGGCGPQLADIVKMLQGITSSQPTFICIDALDECVGVQRVRVLDSLKQILEESPATRIFVTGRPHIQAEMEKRLAGRTTSVSICPTKGDIIEYLRVKLSEDETPDAMDARLEAEILEKIPENISEMWVGAKNPNWHDALIDIFRFLLVFLNIEAILKESTIYRRRERLRKMTGGSGLGDAYSATIERINRQGGDKPRLGMTALMWISHAERPLSADELCHALAIELGSTKFNGDNVPSMSTLLGCCQGLITVDEGASTVRLIHFTLQEYLSTSSDIFSTPHSTMAEICMTYLNSEQVKAVPTNQLLGMLEMPFLKYCSLYWGVHAKRELSLSGRSLALQLLQECDGHISIKYILKQLGYSVFMKEGVRLLFSGLDWASYFGVVEVVAALIEMGCYDTDARGFMGRTPLAWAALNGHEEVVKILLERGEVNPNKEDGYDGTPLAHAACNGHEGVVKVLLGQEAVNSDEPDSWGRTPILYAAGYGHEGVVKTLIGREDVNPHRPDKTGTAPFAYAAQRGHTDVAKIFLAHQYVDPDKPDTWDATLLWHAAAGGDEGAANILLKREEVNLDKPDNDGRTLLSHAASNGHEGVVKILLGCQGVDPDKPDNGGGKTPLWHAASNGHEGVVKILLGCQGVDPDKSDDVGWTPLLPAASRGHEGVVKMLLARKEVNPDHQAPSGQTPLLWAAEHGHEGVVKILLGRKDVTPDKPDRFGQTPLMYAVSNGHNKVIALLQPHGALAPNPP